jgi:hypothetical protein
MEVTGDAWGMCMSYALAGARAAAKVLPRRPRASRSDRWPPTGSAPPPSACCTPGRITRPASALGPPTGTGSAAGETDQREAHAWALGLARR